MFTIKPRTILRGTNYLTRYISSEEKSLLRGGPPDFSSSADCKAFSKTGKLSGHSRRRGNSFELFDATKKKKKKGGGALPDII